MTPTRRLAAIMAADVAGFSAAMERDEEGTFNQVQELRRNVIEPKIAEHQGRLIKTTGDGFLAEFASPLAAMRAALAIQAEASSGALQLRIGLNLGDVIVEENGDVYGDGVNVAARLEGLAEPGGILVSDKIQREVEGKIEAAFEDRGDQQVKNLARPVHVYAARGPAAFATAALKEGQLLALPDKPSIAVLPFDNLSGDTEQDYFCDGIVEDIITELSRFKSLFVIARNSSFTYKGKAVDIKQVGRELGVRYVLEGSLRKAGGRVRITGQLIDANTGAHIWAERFDREMADIFALQDEVTQSVVAAVEPNLRSAEIARKRNLPTQNLNAYDLYLRALAEIGHFTKAGMQAAEVLLRRAVEIDPNYSDALALLADCLGRQVVGGWRADPEAVEEVKQLALDAIRAGPENGLAYAVACAYPVFFGGSIDQGVEYARRAVLLHPNSDMVCNGAGWTFMLSGEFDAALKYLEAGLRMAPFGPRVGDLLGAMAQVYFYQRDFERAGDLANRTLAKMYENPAAWRLKAAALAQAGRVNEARDAVRHLLTLVPRASIATTRQITRHGWMYELYIGGLRKAGLPE